VLAQHLTSLAPSGALRTATASGVAPAGTTQVRVRVAASGARSVVVDDVVVLRR
jgi:hypothetical protein